MNALVALLALALLGLWWRGSRYRAAAAPARPAAHEAPAPAPPALWPAGEMTQYDSCPYCRPHVRAAQAAVARFQAALPAAEAPGAGEDEVRALFRERAGALREMHEVRMRLPNDLDRERRWVALTEALDATLLELIGEARDGAGVPLVHPGPVDDAWYGQWYRASNDAVQ